MMRRFSLAALALLCSSKGAVGAEYRITNTSEFSAFVNNVNNRGASYSGTTVLLDSDLSLSGYTINPIGTSSSYHFCGVFDGQGYVISNLLISKSLQYVGMFGYSTRLTIMNVVLDDSCSVKGTRSGENYVGGIIGRCYASNSQCNIYNSVNMASVTFSGSASGSYSYLGGIAGYLYRPSSGNNIHVTNCANYGPVTHSGTSSYSYIGGIVGYSNNPPSYNYFQNCLNRGAITHSGTTTNNLYLGGIAGCTDESDLYNCLSIGAISTPSIASSSNYIGSIVGYVYSTTCLYYCYFTNIVGISSYYGGGSSPSITNTPSSSTTISDAVSNLNSYSSWNKWLLNTNNAAITFKVNNSEGYSLSSNAIILPNLAASWRSFVGWFTDDSFTTSFSSSSVSGSTTLYGRWNKYRIKYDANGGNVSPTSSIIAYDSTYGELPTPTRDGYTFVGWFTESVGGTVVTPSTKIPVSDYAIYAHWFPNTYTVLFDGNGGHTSTYSKSVTYDEEYGDLPTPTRVGYNFVGWFTETPGGTQVLSSTIMRCSHDHTIYAHWNATQYTISFDPRGGSTCANITQDFNSYVTLPEPNRIGYSFVYWCNDSSTKFEYTVTRMQAEDIVLYAKWNANEYTVTFDTECGFSGSPMSVTYDSTYGIPDPSKSGCNFLWWDVEGSEETVIATSTVSVARNHVLCAVWDKNEVKFNTTGGDDNLTPVEATYNEKYGTLPTATKTGHEFVGWFTEEGVPVSSEDKVTIPYAHTLYARWEVIYYNVTFDLGYDDKVTVRTVAYSSKIVYPDDPGRKGYTFLGWNKTLTEMPDYSFVVGAVWGINRYTVKFDYMNETTFESVFQFGDRIIYPENPEREGYTFKGWDGETTYMPSYNITIKAAWEANEYAVTFDVNGGNELEVNGMKVTFNSTYGPLPIPSKDGCAFAGWVNTNNDTVTSKTTVNVTGDHTLYARWGTNKYTVTLDANGGDLQTSEIEVTFNGVYGELSNPTKEGYTFIGWFNNDENITSESTVTTPGNHTLQARWAPNTLTVTLNADGGDLQLSEIEVVFNERYGELPSPTKEGYTFVGWFYGNKNITSDTVVSIPRTHTLQARWVSDKCVAILDVNGGDALQVSEIEVVFNENYGELPSPQREGYTFVGWFNDNNENVTSETTVSVAHAHILQAQWEANNYTVTLDENEGEKLSENKTIATFNDKYKLPSPTREGYTFAGWFNDNNENITNETTVTTPGNHTLQAQWTANTYAITFDVDGGDALQVSEIEVVFNERYGELPTTHKDGYSFIGWLNDGVIVTSETNVTTPRNHTLKACWGTGNYAVTLDVNGGNELENKTKDVTFNENYGELPTPTRVGYTFVGWFNNNDENVTRETKVTIPYTHTLYADWKANEYKVKFDVNGGDALQVSEIKVVFNEGYGELPKPDRAGYTFAWWLTDSSEKVTEETIVSTPADHALHAHWTANTYIVTFDMNGGDDDSAPDPITVTYDGNYGKLGTATQTGYSFTGWFTDKNVSVSSGTKVTTPDDHVLHAGWTANKYVVTFDTGGGAGLAEPEMTVTFGDAYGELPVPSKVGHTFSWWTDALSSGNEVSNATIVNIPNNHTLYAIWTVNKYTMTFVFEDGTSAQSTLNFNDRIIYPNDSPQKSFHKFRKWCTSDDAYGGAKVCNVTNVPAGDVTFAASFDVDSGLVAGTTVAVAAGAFIIAMAIVVAILAKIIFVNKLKLRYKPVGIELEEDIPVVNEEIERRISKQIEAISISNDFAKKLETTLGRMDKSKGLEEVITDLDINFEDEDSADAVELFRTSDIAQVIADAVNNETNLVAAAEYLGLLYAAAGRGESYESFSELYIGMKNTGEFTGRIDEKTISFGGIVSGFTSKSKVIQFLMPKTDDEGDSPNGVLFRVRKGKGYMIGELDEDTSEVLFEIGSVFKIESIKEPVKDKYFVVDLLFVSPKTEADMIKL